MILANEQIRKVRTVTRTPLEAEVVVDAGQPWKRARFEIPDDAAEPADTSPRDDHPRTTVILGAALGQTNPLALGVGDRVERRGDVEIFEALTEQREVRAGDKVEGFAVEVLNLEDLYPYLASIEPLGGGPSAADEIPCSIYGVAERDTDRGEYRVATAEIPIEFAAAAAAPNRQLVLGASRYSITDAQPVHDRAFTRLAVRLA